MIEVNQESADNSRTFAAYVANGTFRVEFVVRVQEDNREFGAPSPFYEDVEYMGKIAKLGLQDLLNNWQPR